MYSYNFIIIEMKWRNNFNFDTKFKDHLNKRKGE